jgi:hypothetical protein
MHRAIVFAATLIAVTTSNADAAEWCGYSLHAKSPIECGYSSDTECESAVGKGGVCFIDPEYAANKTRVSPAEMLLPTISPKLGNEPANG